MNDVTYERLLQLPRANLVNLMMEALDYMQQFNGRGRTTCIMMALNAKEVDEKKWQIPTVAEMKKATQNGWIE
jgi:hypothetical protein